jgi:hypothetical protein
VQGEFAVADIHPTSDTMANVLPANKPGQDWTNPHDPDAKVTKMKDGRTHLAHKAEHAVDLETGAMVAVTLQGADEGDTTTIRETATAAAEQIEDAQAEVVASRISLGKCGSVNREPVLLCVFAEHSHDRRPLSTDASDPGPGDRGLVFGPKNLPQIGAGSRPGDSRIQRRSR